MTLGQDLFDEYNARYFQGRLPRYRVRFVPARYYGWNGELDHKLRTIYLAADGTSVDRVTLLDEMCHHGAPFHGKRFRAKLLRLAAQGVEWAREEAEGYENAPTWNADQAEVREKLDEIASTIKPRPTFREVRRYIHERHLPADSIPWLKAAWGKACREADIPQQVRAARMRRAVAAYKRSPVTGYTLRPATAFQRRVDTEAKQKLEFLWIRRQWNDWRIAKVRLGDLSDFRWTDTSGGAMARSPRKFIHAYMSCRAPLEGEVAHSGLHGPCPHRIKVCVVKKDNDPKTFARLEEMASS